MTQLHCELQHAKTTRDLRYSYSNEVLNVCMYVSSRAEDKAKIALRRQESLLSIDCIRKYTFRVVQKDRDTVLEL